MTSRPEHRAAVEAGYAPLGEYVEKETQATRVPDVTFLDGRVQLFLGDCRTILPMLGKVDALVTDPPYGIGRDGMADSRYNGKPNGKGRKGYKFLGWDSSAPDQEVFDLMLDAAGVHIIWGGNYFSDKLPPAMKWLVWDKGQRIQQSDGELAWTSIGGALRIATFGRHLLHLDNAEHPTQKPVGVMKWCIAQLPDEADTILDPFAGSGSTGVAAIKMGKRFIGIEREKSYFDIMVRRLSEAADQPDLFIEKTTKPTQPDFLVEASSDG